MPSCWMCNSHQVYRKTHLPNVGTCEINSVIMYESRFAWLQREQSFRGIVVVGEKELHTQKESQLTQQYIIIMEADRQDTIELSIKSHD